MGADDIHIQAGAADQIVDVATIFKLHLFLGLTIFLVFPFTRLVHMLSVPLRYLTRPGYQVVRSRRSEPLPKQSAAATSVSKSAGSSTDPALDPAE